MNLLFDLKASQPNPTGKRHGGGKYCEVIFKALLNKTKNFSVFYDSSLYLNPEILDLCEKNGIQKLDLHENSLKDYVNKEKARCIYSALPEGIQPWPDITILGTIHGLRKLELPFDFWGRFLFKISFRKSVKNFFKQSKKKKADKAYYRNLLTKKNFKFVTVSQHSRSVIEELCPELKGKIPVYYSPSTISTPYHTEAKEKFFLLVSANRFEKNCVRAIMALDKLFTAKKLPDDFKVKITGAESSFFRYKIQNPKQFVFLGYVEEFELDDLYSKAFAFIYPTLNEGFGYPPLEAMRYGTPALVSKVASIPEVCGDAGLYFNPFSIKNIEQSITVILNHNYYNLYSSEGKNRYAEILKKQNRDLDKMTNWIIRDAEQLR